MSSRNNDVLAANDAFYQAFATGDYMAMDGIWADTVAVSCIHPGWPPVRGRDKVMQTWRGILASPPRPTICALEAEATEMGDFALVVCFEAIGDIYLSASNFFLRDNGIWRLVHHQSGETAKPPKSLEKQPTGTIH